MSLSKRVVYIVEVVTYNALMIVGAVAIVMACAPTAGNKAPITRAGPANCPGRGCPLDAATEALKKGGAAGGIAKAQVPAKMSSDQLITSLQKELENEADEAVKKESLAQAQKVNNVYFKIAGENKLSVRINKDGVTSTVDVDLSADGKGTTQVDNTIVKLTATCLDQTPSAKCSAFKFELEKTEPSAAAATVAVDPAAKSDAAAKKDETGAKGLTAVAPAPAAAATQTVVAAKRFKVIMIARQILGDIKPKEDKSLDQKSDAYKTLYKTLAANAEARQGAESVKKLVLETSEIINGSTQGRVSILTRGYELMGFEGDLGYKAKEAAPATSINFKKSTNADIMKDVLDNNETKANLQNSIASTENGVNLTKVDAKQLTFLITMASDKSLNADAAAVAAAEAKKAAAAKSKQKPTARVSEKAPEIIEATIDLTRASE